MTSYEFDQLMNVVKSRWGEKAYPHILQERIWFFVKDLPQKSFEKMVYTLLDSSRMAPMPHEFKMLAYGEKERLGIGRDKEPQTKPSCESKCWDCGDSGNLFAVHKTKNTTTTFRCHCKAGSEHPTGHGQQWNASWAQVYDKEPIYPDVKGDWRPREGMRLVSTVIELASLKRGEAREGNLEKVNFDPDDGGSAA